METDKLQNLEINMAYSGAVERAVSYLDTGEKVANKELITGLISDGVVISNITDSGNWTNDVYTGPAITVYEGQYYYDSLYKYEAKLDNSIVRLFISSSMYNFSNGLTENAGTVVLGGSLIENTNIDLGGNTLSFDGIGDIDIDIINGTSSAEFEISPGYVLLKSNSPTYGGELSFSPSRAEFAFHSNILEISHDEIIFYIDASNAFIRYGHHPSGTVVDTSMPDVKWIKEHLGGQDVDALIETPTATEDGYVIAWNNTNSEYELVAGSSSNIPTSLSTGTVNATTYGITSDGGTDDVVLVSATTALAGLLTAAKWNEIVANNAKITNVTTNLSIGTRTATTVPINSSDGTNATLAEATTTYAGLLGADKWDEIVANSLKTSNATHTGDVTGSVALTIATDAVDIPMLSATGTASSSTYLCGNNVWTDPKIGVNYWTLTGVDLNYNTGDVGIGLTTNPQERLHVEGNIRANIHKVFAGTNYVGWVYGGYTSSSDNYVSLENNDADGGLRIYDTDGHAVFVDEVTADDFLLSSDRRLKTEIDYELKDVSIDGLKPTGFLLNGKFKYGFIAQDMLETHPKLVNGTGVEKENGEIDYYSIKENSIVAIVVKEVQQLKIKIVELENKNSILENRLLRIEKLLL